MSVSYYVVLLLPCTMLYDVLRVLLCYPSSYVICFVMSCGEVSQRWWCGVVLKSTKIESSDVKCDAIAIDVCDVAKGCAVLELMVV